MAEHDVKDARALPQASGCEEGAPRARRSVAIAGMTVREIERMVAGAPPEPGDILWEELRADPRKGVSQVLERLARRRARVLRERDRLAGLRHHEAELWASGCELVAGVDEAGRGPLAGPVVAAAVVLPRDCVIAGLNDSKKLSPKKREELYRVILDTAVAVGIGSSSEKLIDEVNILNATHRAMRDAVADLGRVPDHVLVDGTSIPELSIPQTAINRGDERSAPIAAASIIAKVTRDRLLVKYDEQYPGYGFARHKGYGTSEHLAALRRLGPCEIHRRSFRVVLDAGGGLSEQYAKFRSDLLSAEAAEELERIAGEIARVKDSLVPYELARLRSLYKRCYVRVRAGLAKVG